MLRRHSTHGQRAEKLTSNRLAGKRRHGSGSIEGYKGDIEVADFLLENKSTIKKSISIKLDWGGYSIIE